MYKVVHGWLQCANRVVKRDIGLGLFEKRCVQGTQPVKWSEADVFISSPWTVDGKMIYGTVRTVCFINVWHCVCESVGFICLSLVSVAMAMFPLSCLWTRLVKWVKVIFPLQDHTSDKGWWVLYSHTQMPPCKHNRSHFCTSFPCGHDGLKWFCSYCMMCLWMYICTYRETDGPVVI